MSTSFQKHPVSSFFIFFVCSFKQKTCTRVAIVEKESKFDPLRGILTRSPLSDPCHGELPTSLPSSSCKPRSPRRLYVCLLMVPPLQQPRIKPCSPLLYVWLLQLFRLLPSLQQPSIKKWKFCCKFMFGCTNFTNTFKVCSALSFILCNLKYINLVVEGSGNPWQRSSMNCVPWGGNYDHNPWRGNSVHKCRQF